jgi:hypothetical protein
MEPKLFVNNQSVFIPEVKLPEFVQLNFAENLKNILFSFFGKEEWGFVSNHQGKQGYVKIAEISKENGISQNKIRRLFKWYKASALDHISEAIELRKLYRNYRQELNGQIQKLQAFEQVSRSLNRKQIKELVTYVATKAQLESDKLQKDAAPIVRRKSATLLARSVEIHPDSEIYIHLGSLVGRGGAKSCKTYFGFCWIC